MSIYNFRPYFGFIVNAGDSNCNSSDVTIISEEFLADRWILLYKKREQNSEPFARYILFDTWCEQNFVKKYAPIVNVGVSLDISKQYIIIEQSSQGRWILIYDYSNGEKSLVRDMITCPAFYRRGESTTNDLIADQVAAATALSKIPQLYDKIVDTRMVASLYHRKSYIFEQGTTGTWIHVYIWFGISWRLQRTYQTVTTRVRSRHAPVVHILLCTGVTKDTLLVVEENDVMRWWHTYRLTDNFWKYISSNEILLKRTAVINN